AEFSFLLSIPIILASLVYELIGGSGEFSFEVLPMTVAFIIAFLVGIFSIKFMLKIIKKVKLGWFSLYLVVLSFALLFLL
ncbi:MAG: undecaprenyl-diphosphatase, partial [Christensenellaceae bacterium]|nr:undecaprenyl-diphosphatase [Christensenellaceae bacterium]